MIAITNDIETLYISKREANILFANSQLHNIKHIQIANNDWDIFKSFIEKQPKISLHNTHLLQVINNNIMEHLRINIIPKYDVIIKYGLYGMYEQLVFYKYIYMSPDISLCEKLEIILENNYTAIMDMIENNILDICINSTSDTTDIKTLYTYYYDNVLFSRFVNLHTDWMSCDMKSFTHNLLNVYELYYLTKINIIDAATYVNNLHMQLIFDTEIIHNKHTLLCEYKVYEMFIDMIERNILTCSDKIKKKILLKWLKINTFEHTIKFNICDLHKLTLTKNIRLLLKTMIINFSEIGYVLSTNDIKVFKILCDKLPFNKVHIALYKNLSIDILQYISTKTNINAIININIYECINHTPKTLEILMDDITINLLSINSTYKHTESMYIMMFWDYYKLLMYNPEIIINILTICMAYVNIDFYLDLIIIKIVIDNMKATNFIINKYMNLIFDKIINDERLYLTGPDLCEIKNELEIYNVKNTFLDDIC
jgi:hypothetical protein